MSTSTRLPVATGRQTLAAVARLLRPRAVLLVVIVLVLLAAAVAGLVTPWALGRLVDAAGAGSASTSSVLAVAGSVLAAGLLGAVLTGLGQILAARLFETTLARLREDLVADAFALPQAQVERAGTGDLVSRASDDITQISDGAPRIIPALTGAGFTIVVTLAGTALIDPRFALALLVLLPVYAWTLRWYLRTAPPVYAAERAAAAERAHHLLAALRGVDTVHAFRIERRHIGRIARASWDMVRWTMRARTVQNLFYGRLNLAEYLGVVLLLCVGFLLLRTGSASVGEVTTALLFFLRLFGPINQLMLVIDDAQSAVASLARVVGVGLERPRGGAGDEDGPAGATSAPATSAPAASLDGVDFGYEPDRPVLHGIDLVLEPGTTTALVGPSGAGKTTIAALLAGIHETDTGSVRSPVRTALVSQETHVFTGTLRENLTLAAPGAEDHALDLALDTVHGRDLLESLPEGLDTFVGQGGHPLTAAESQQIALTRLLLAAPELAILDEATAEADSSDAGLLERGAAAVTEGRTGLVIAHRLSQAAACDRIVVLEDGRITETGTHDQLVASGGTYAGLWAAWSDGRG
jgi:ATP-binding cassette subfamily C protein